MESRDRTTAPSGRWLERPRDRTDRSERGEFHPCFRPAGHGRSQPPRRDWSHWRNLRRRFNREGEEAIGEQEVLEALLALATGNTESQQDLAAGLLSRFGDLASVLGASPRLPSEAMGQTRRSGYRITAMPGRRPRRGRQGHAPRDHRTRPVMSSYESVVCYCQALMADQPQEQFRILFLNKKNILITDEIHGRGTVDHVPLYPREVARRALELGASAVIMVHNHPSGDPSPSAADIDMTRKVIDAPKLFEIIVHDHIIVGAGRHSSFRSRGLLEGSAHRVRRGMSSPS
ncbi:MAG: DNA repair protein RadC [Geminicoccaceae bacterium]